MPVGAMGLRDQASLGFGRVLEVEEEGQFA